MRYRTKEGYVACLQKEWLSDFMRFIVAKDMDSAEAYIKSSRCVMLKPGVTVTLGSASFFGGTVSFFLKGTEFWTVTEALERSR